MNQIVVENTGFSLLRGGWEESPHQPKFCSSPPLEKFPPFSRLPLLPPTNFYSLSTKNQFSPTKQQFSSYNPIKAAFLAVVTAPAPFLF